MHECSVCDSAISVIMDVSESEKIMAQDAFLTKLLSFLPTKDVKNCRLVSSTWKLRVDGTVLFSVRLSDATLNRIKNPTSSVRTKVIAHNLRLPIPKGHYKFLTTIRELHIEQSVSNVTDDGTPDFNRRSVSLENSRRLLYHSNNVKKLVMNEGALCPEDLVEISFDGLSMALPRLKTLNVIVVGQNQLHVLSRLFVQYFPSLESLSVTYIGVDWSKSFEYYAEILAFILKHKTSIKQVNLKDPPMAPRSRSKIENPCIQWYFGNNEFYTSVIPPAICDDSAIAGTYENQMNQFREQFAQAMQLTSLTLRFSKNLFSCWGLGIKLLLESQSTLCDLELERIPGVLAEQLAWENSGTLKKLSVSGIDFSVAPQVPKDFNCSSLKNCNKLEELVLQDFLRYLNIDRIPMRKLRVLTLVTYSNIGIDCVPEPLCPYDVALKMSENLVVARRIKLFPANMITCELLKEFFKLQALKEITLIGYEKQHGVNEHYDLSSNMVNNQFLDAVTSTPAPTGFIKKLRKQENGQNILQYCSDPSSLSSGLRIFFPSAPANGLWVKLPSNIRKHIFKLLPRDDLCTCRLVSRQFAVEAQKQLLFGFTLSDATKDFVCKTNLRNIEYLAVGDLRSVISEDKFYFVRYVKTLVLEHGDNVLRKNFQSEENFDEDAVDDVTIEKAFGVGEEACIHPLNILRLLQASHGLRTLFFNQWSLTNFVGANRLGIKNKVFQDIAYKNLRCLHFVVHCTEVDAMLQFLNLEFNTKTIELSKLCIQILGIPKGRPSSVDIYERILKFVGNHETLTEFRMVDPVFTSETGGKYRSDIDPSLALMADKCRCCCMKLLTSVHLQTLTLIFKEISPKWNVGLVFLRAQRYLSEVWLEGLPMNEVHTVIINSAETLSTIRVVGSLVCKKKSSFDFSYTKNCSRLLVLVVENVDVENLQDLPGSIQELKIMTLPLKNNPWNISTSLNRSRSRSTVSPRIARNFQKRFQSLRAVHLVNIGCLHVELFRLFLKLPVLDVLVCSEVHKDVLVVAGNFPGVTVEQSKFKSQAHEARTIVEGLAKSTPRNSIVVVKFNFNRS